MLLFQPESTIHDEFRSGNIGGILRSKEDDAFCDVFGCTQPLNQMHFLANLTRPIVALARGIRHTLHRRSAHFRVDNPGLDSVDADVVTECTDFPRHGAREQAHRTF